MKIYDTLKLQNGLIPTKLYQSNLNRYLAIEDYKGEFQASLDGLDVESANEAKREHQLITDYDTWAEEQCLTIDTIVQNTERPFDIKYKGSALTDFNNLLIKIRLKTLRAAHKSTNEKSRPLFLNSIFRAVLVHAKLSSLGSTLDNSVQVAVNLYTKMSNLSSPDISEKVLFNKFLHRLTLERKGGEALKLLYDFGILKILDPELHELVSTKADFFNVFKDLIDLDSIDNSFSTKFKEAYLKWTTAEK